MTEDHVHPVRVEAPADRGTEVGWEPPDWSDVLRRHRRLQLATAAAFVLLVCATPVMWWTGIDRSVDWSYWAFAVGAIICVGEVVHSHVSAAGRASWEQDTRRKVRVEHALRHHVSVGAADRPLVTERAREVATVSKVAFVGWPLLAVVLAAGILQDHLELPDFLVVPVAAACLLLVGRSVRRGRLARRWLADPLPRDDGTR